MKLAFNCTIVPDWTRGRIPIFILTMPFFSSDVSPFSMIEVDAIFTVQLNGSGRGEISMTLSDFVEEEVVL